MEQMHADGVDGTSGGEGANGTAGWSPPELFASDRPRVLVVDDDVDFARLTARRLFRVGIRCELAHSLEEAWAAYHASKVDVIVSDLWMPGPTGAEGRAGLELLGAIRDAYPDVGVVLMTAEPELSSATRAMELEASGYVFKGDPPETLVAAIERAGKRTSHERQLSQQAAEQRLLLREQATELDRALATLRMAYQPITDRDGEPVGHEALMRVATSALPHPGAVIDRALSLGRLGEVSRRVMGRVALDAQRLRGDLFINIHPQDLFDPGPDDLFGRLASLAYRVVIEVTEAATIRDTGALQRRLTELRSRGFRIALDDLGAGFSALSRLALLEPDIVKLDMSLVRDIDGSPKLQRIVRSLVELCSAEGAAIVAEGIESEAERTVLVELGCTHLQGYLLGRPAFPPGDR
ncbi:MAG: hypothetical protein CMN30_13355 [Sandaracinus sp.]|nr:hypothetical protein [Sandaracinus sp.]|tara:strand:+ start:1788 stop:3014 length:1227 start_codon:yes stop_codon:yes gene_type:complete